ncbi:hypothetical protein MGN70_010277 [Eutypa lata]|nr:hypothetical protein MGN70_010277 [Eutypa lata]
MAVMAATYGYPATTSPGSAAAACHLRYSHGFASRAVSAFDDDDDEYFVRFHNAARSDSRQSVLRLLDYYETPRAGDGDVAADGKVYYLAGALTD